MITLADTDIGYGRTVVGSSLSLALETGCSTAIIGPNGAGKSTLLKTICGVLPPVRGKVSFTGCSRSDISYLPQRAEIDRSAPVSALDLVLLGSWHRTGGFGAARGMSLIAQRALERVGLADAAGTPIRALSIGQFQRALFARLVVQDARIILLDEPFAAVDAGTTAILLEVIGGWRDEGRTVIAALHDLHQVRNFFDRAVILDRRVVAHDSVGQVLASHAVHACFGLDADCHVHQTC